MLYDSFIDCKKIDSRFIDLADTVVSSRPFPNRAYDQIYMQARHLVLQGLLLLDYVSEKSVAFLGDGDGISVFVHLLAREIGVSINKSCIFDFDERILKNYTSFSEKYNLTGIQTKLYNVLEPLPESFLHQYDFFYINPPYGSKNSGLSCIAWLHRCLDLCANVASGLIVIPYDPEMPWTISAMCNVQRFLLDYGFVIRDMVSQFHKYHLEDNPQLKSASLIVDRIDKKDSEFQGTLLPISFAKNLYGSSCSLPRYIWDDGSKQGKPDYNWEYGAIS